MEPVTAMIRGIRVGFREAGNPDGEPLVLLHGFTGSSASWTVFADELGAFRLIMPDLTGHGETEAPEAPGRYAMAEQVADLDALFTRLGLARFSLLGYSMGGRIAIGYAAAHPEKVSRLILESTSPGLRTEEERLERRESDGKLAAFIEREGIRAFTDRWENVPLFASQKQLPAHVKQRVRNGRLGNDPAGLAGSLRGIGTGSQPSYWESLERYGMPVTLITGALDNKYVNIAKDMSRRLPDVHHVNVPDAGHTVHVENPARFATIVRKALKP
ncbi:2-succinyl-6-hydroxy-2,4-cyclohexadiene-1-carboxylate synthase [Bhargavaea massiliensis]|uniref:2-succinyl-6-hydroxy-2, 4-cyclohexadiene-1-carboxylate synthase n=1 Tax=Bhargavaea massiliensis TaxID=2697500 RepID=UPI001BCEE015|nr:2-succinyl-6-hydroxy-2,4-cyclohexadiene-1-carboxylate synthase [Bhargavaea massiliensis]